MAAKKTVCVIGAGGSGLTAVKQCVDEGLDVKCFELEARVGGIFNWGEDKNGVYDNTILTISASLMCFSDMPAKEGVYWTHAEYLQYMNAYAEKFGLLKFVQFKTKVENVKRVGEKWRVSVRSTSGVSTADYDSLVVSSGNFQIGKMPQIPGLAESGIELQHSTVYKNNEGFKGKNAVVVGMGESGADLAREISDVAKTCTVALRSLPCLFPRLPNYRAPTDGYTFRSHHYLFTRELSARFGITYDPYYDGKAFGIQSRPVRAVLLGLLLFATWLNLLFLWFVMGPINVVKNLVGAGPKVDSMRQPTDKLRIDFDSDADPRITDTIDAWYRLNGGKYFGLMLFYPFKFLVKNACFMPNLMAKKYTLNCSGVDKVVGKTVYYKDGRKSEDVDVIMFCTGYKDHFPFFEDPALKDFPAAGVRGLYRHCFRPDVGKSLCYIGWVRPISGGVPAASEMLARYFAALNCGRLEDLPANVKELTATQAEYENTALHLSLELRTLIVSQSQFFDSIARDLGCEMNILDYVFDPYFVYKQWLGPFLPTIYRIKGPHKLPNAYAFCREHAGIPLMTNPVPTDFFAARFPLIGLLMGIDNFLYEVFGKSVFLPWMHKVTPNDDDTPHLYGYDNSKVDYFNPNDPESCKRALNKKHEIAKTLKAKKMF